MKIRLVILCYTLTFVAVLYCVYAVSVNTLNDIRISALIGSIIIPVFINIPRLFPCHWGVSQGKFRTVSLFFLLIVIVTIYASTLYMATNDLYVILQEFMSLIWVIILLDTILNMLFEEYDIRKSKSK